MGLDIWFRKVKGTESTKLAYYRKVNFLVNFFVKKGFDIVSQTDYPVEKEDIEELIQSCWKVIVDNESAPKELPTMDGFFFGSTDYDDWYFEDVAEVLKDCEEVILPMFDKLDEDESIIFSIWY